MTEGRRASETPRQRHKFDTCTTGPIEDAINTVEKKNTEAKEETQE